MHFLKQFLKSDIIILPQNAKIIIQHCCTSFVSYVHVPDNIKSRSICECSYMFKYILKAPSLGWKTQPKVRFLCVCYRGKQIEFFMPHDSPYSFLSSFFFLSSSSLFDLHSYWSTVLRNQCCGILKSSVTQVSTDRSNLVKVLIETLLASPTSADEVTHQTYTERNYTSEQTKIFNIS